MPEMTTVASIDTIAAVAVVRAQNRPSRKITQMPGVTKPVKFWMYWKAWPKLPRSGFVMRIAMTIDTTATMRPDGHELLLLGVRPRRAIQVHREDGRDRIDLRSGRRNDGRDQRREHEALDADGQHGHEARIGLVGLLETRHEHQRRDAGQHDDRRHHQLEERREHDALLRLVHALGREAALDDVLIEAPVR